MDEEGAPQGAADASWGTERNFKSRTGLIFRFAGGPVTWYSGKQAPTAVSSAESRALRTVRCGKRGEIHQGCFSRDRY